MRYHFFIKIILFSLSMPVLGQINPANIDIIRDQWGVPHIHAPTDPEVAYGLAWAHSEDDFKSIQLSLLAGNRMLGRYLGKKGAAIDYVSNLLRCEELAREKIHTLSPDFLALLNGYVGGLNSYAKSHPKEVLVKRLFPMEVEDLISAYVLSLSVFSGADKVIKDLFANRTEPAPMIDGVKGSNAIAISRSKTEDDYTYIAINSHQPLEGPLAWYEAHVISDEGWNMMGGLFPGGATIFHGTNEFLGWAHTVNFPDKMDVFELQMHPDDKYRYKYDDQWLTLESRKAKMKVKLFLGLKIGVKKEVLWSVYGPAVRNKSGVFAFWTGALEDIRATEQWYRMNKATNFQEFEEALKMVAIPGFNIIYADRESNIYHLGNGKIPFRDPKFDWSETLPGNTSSTKTQGYHPLKDLPQNLNPNSGFVFNMNNSAFSSAASGNNPIPADHDSTMGFLVWENNRSARFLELIAEHEQLSYDELLNIKYDGQLPDSLHFLISMNDFMHLNGNKRPELMPLLNIIQQWDRKTDENNVGAAQFTVVYMYLRNKFKHRKEYLYDLSEEECWEALAFAKKYLEKHHSKIGITLGEYQQHIRGNMSLPIWGIPDAITAMYAFPDKKKRMKAYAGESYIMMVRYPKNGLPIIETVNAYGTSSKKESAHFTDQMQMFVQQKRKRMTLDLEKVYQSAKRVYHPGN
ncbi:MAG: penicillin acylase family protein [Cyclobacteriaceae bacterium]|nr:penicillin acylase family protein [Cyclobacteriaceae bacterium HetDA_MAG_MS6]